MKNQTGISYRIWELRAKLQISQLELARKSGVIQATLSRIENGVTPNPMSNTALKIATALGVSLQFLITGETGTKQLEWDFGQGR